MSKNGFRVPPAPTKNEEMRNIKTELQNLQMAGRVSQMLTQRLMTTLQNMSQDLGSALNQLYELQYKYSAMQKHLNLPVEALNDLANQQRLLDFNEGSAKQDIKDNLVVADEVSGDSTVTLTSVAKDADGNDRGIFRSRLKLSESGAPDLITALVGKKVGDKVNVKLNDVDHEIELLTIRNSLPTLEVTSNDTQEVASEATH